MFAGARRLPQVETDLTLAPSPALERRALQIAVALAGLVPVGAGLWGVLGGLEAAAFSGGAVATHLRYLSGLLLGIGLAFWAAVPAIERRGVQVRLLALIVLVGGLARLIGAVQGGVWGWAVVAPLVMELGVTPGLALWRERVERRVRAG